MSTIDIPAALLTAMISLGASVKPPLSPSIQTCTQTCACSVTLGPPIASTSPPACYGSSGNTTFELTDSVPGCCYDGIDENCSADNCTWQGEININTGGGTCTLIAGRNMTYLARATGTNLSTIASGSMACASNDKIAAYVLVNGTTYEEVFSVLVRCGDECD